MSARFACMALLVGLAFEAVAHSEFGPCTLFPADNPWNTPVDDLPVHPRSAAFIAAIGPDDRVRADFGTTWKGIPNGIPFNVVDGPVQFRDVELRYAKESDAGPWPIEDSFQIEQASDRHLLVVDTRLCWLYELFAVTRPGVDGVWRAESGAIFDLRSNRGRPAGWTSADAAGLPILPGLVRYHEVVEHGEINHALRFTVGKTAPAWIPPASHWASWYDEPDLPPMGLRLRLRADYDCEWMSEEAQVICVALKRYGMILADNGADWFVSGAPDPRWDDDALGHLKGIRGRDLEVVYTGEPRRIPASR